VAGASERATARERSQGDPDPQEIAFAELLRRRKTPARSAARQSARRVRSGAPLTNTPWKRNFLVTWPSLFLVSLGLMAVIPVLPLYVERKCGLTDPDLVRSWSAWIYAAGPFAAALTGPLWGALGDRIGRKTMVVRSSAAIALCMALMPLAPGPEWMFAVRLLQGVFAGYVAPAIALVAGGVPADRHGRTIGRLQVALATGSLAGPAVGAEIFVRWGGDSAFWFGALCAGLGAASVALFVREDRSQLQTVDAGELLHEVLRAPLRLVRHRAVLALLGLIVLMRLGQNMQEPFVALWVRELGPLPAFRHAGEADSAAVERTTALAFAVLAGAQLLCTPLWGRLSDRVGPLRCLAAVCLALAVVQWFTAGAASIGDYLGLRCIAAAFMAGSMTLAYAALTRRAPRAEQATAFALAQSCIQLGLSIGPTVGAVAANSVGLRGLFSISAAILLASGIGMLVLRWWSPPADRLPPPPTAEVVG
jgi:DHA1 family multidrug resistance protein-like MFS transporter